jgi:hypothetical protein
MREKGLIFKPDLTKSFKIYSDADFCGLWNNKTAMADPAIAKSRTGLSLCLLDAHCFGLWTSCLQTKMALSTTEFEYLSLSDTLRETISMRCASSRKSLTKRLSTSIEFQLSNASYLETIPELWNLQRF